MIYFYKKNYVQNFTIRDPRRSVNHCITEMNAQSCKFKNAGKRIDDLIILGSFCSLRLTIQRKALMILQFKFLKPKIKFSKKLYRIIFFNNVFRIFQIKESEEERSMIPDAP